MNPRIASPGLALAAYAETLCRGARALIVGDARTPLAGALLERGARLVHVIDHDPARRAEAAQRATHRGLSYGSLDDGPAALRESFFDLALVENLAAQPNTRAAIQTVSRLLAPRGAVLVAAPNPDVDQALIGVPELGQALDYYALYDAVAAAFPHVRMLGQVPFVAYAVVDFAAEGEPNPVLDASLLPARGEEPDYFVALAGREARTLEEYAVIQLPSRLVQSELSDADEATHAPLTAPSPEAAPGRDADALAKTAALELRIRTQESWIAELELRASTADERADAAEAELDELRDRLARHGESEELGRRTLASEHDAMRGELETARRKLDEHDVMRGELETARRKLDELAAELERRQGELELRSSELQQRTRELQQRDATLAELHAKLAQRDAELGQRAQELAQRSAELAQRDAELAALANDAESAQELARLEAQLADRSHEIRRLERQLHDAERTGRELVRKLTQQLGSTAPGLSARLAEAEAELVTLRWSLAMAASAGASTPAVLG